MQKIRKIVVVFEDDKVVALTGQGIYSRAVTVIPPTDEERAMVAKTNELITEANKNLPEKDQQPLKPKPADKELKYVTVTLVPEPGQEM